MSSTANINNDATANTKKQNTKQELIANNIKLLIEQLEAGHSNALTNYLTAMSRFHQYSFGNVLEIARQMPTATRVAGFWTWKNLGRNVKAGQKGIRILAPIVGVRRKKETEANKDITRQNERVLLGFRNAYVFDVSQTDGVDLPEMHLRGGQRDMAKMVCDLLKRNAFGQQMRRARVPERVWAIAWQYKFEPMQAVAYHRAESRSGEGSIRLDARQKDLSQPALRYAKVDLPALREVGALSLTGLVEFAANSERAATPIQMRGSIVALRGVAAISLGGLL